MNKNLWYLFIATFSIALSGQVFGQTSDNVTGEEIEFVFDDADLTSNQQNKQSKEAIDKAEQENNKNKAGSLATKKAEMADEKDITVEIEELD